jgi:hypothetical protein
VKDLISSLPSATVISIERHTSNYCHWKPLIPFRAPTLVRKIFFRIRLWFLNKGLIDSIFDQALIKVALLLNAPMDQTLGKAQAQIEVVAQKNL